KTRARGMAKGNRIDRGAHLLGREHAALALEAAQHHAGERRRPAGFGMERVRARREDDLVALPAVHARGDLVAHRARRGVARCFLAELVADSLGDGVHRRILIRLLFAAFRLRDRPTQAGRRLSPCVAVQIDHAGTSSEAAATSRVATGSFLSQTALWWIGPPP